MIEQSNSLRVQSQRIAVRQRLAKGGKLARIGMFTKNTAQARHSVIICIPTYFTILVKVGRTCQNWHVYPPLSGSYTQVSWRCGNTTTVKNTHLGV